MIPGRCPVDEARKEAYEYLCRGCWYTLQPSTRTALSRRDALAAARLAELRYQISVGTRLADIRIA